MYQFCTLYSGSSGNATYIGDESAGILIDIGRNAKQTTLALDSLGLSPEAVKAVFVTHEHTDHVAGLRVFCKRHHIPVYASLGTLQALDEKGCLDGNFPTYQMTDFADVGDYHIASFPISHDAAEPTGYRVTLPNGRCVAVSTDLGVVTEAVRQAILGCSTVLLESNHDRNMLFNGPYPYPLKRRIDSAEGHLNNEAAAETSAELLESGTTQIILGHLSSQNNLPELAFETASQSLRQDGAKIGLDIRLAVAPRQNVLRTEVSE
ncbi:MAG: MBL fold metallo-hydrolase [Oscillospiraceae bacterium]|nr:MBL fold metallo-hydrolase [Oscillospiraceae bacterium]